MSSVVHAPPPLSCPADALPPLSFFLSLPTRKSGWRSPHKRMSVSLDSLKRAESVNTKALTFQAEMGVKDLVDERKRRAFALAAAASVLVGIVSYFVSGIYGMKMRYPRLFRWYDRMRAEKEQGEGRHDFSLYQVCTAANFQAAQQLLNLLLVWRDLRFPPANFLLFTIDYFDRKSASDPKAALTSLHWSGSRAQTKYDKLVGPSGWASTGCATGTLEQKKATLISNWNAGKDENIWYHMLPKPVDEASKLAFLSVPMIAELYTDSSSSGGSVSACDPETFANDSKLGRLFDGGLCNVAFMSTRSDQASADLFNEYFATHYNASVSQSCNGAASAGGFQGAMSGGMSGLMLLQMMPPLPGPLGLLKVGAALAVTAGATAAGAATSAAAAKARCKRDDGE